MCTVSMILDHYRDKWRLPPNPTDHVSMPSLVVGPSITREEFDALKRDVLEMKELLKRAKKYDEDNGEPDCEMEEKVALVRKVCELVGVNIDDILSPKSA